MTMEDTGGTIHDRLALASCPPPSPRLSSTALHPLPQLRYSSSTPSYTLVFASTSLPSHVTPTAMEPIPAEVLLLVFLHGFKGGADT